MPELNKIFEINSELVSLSKSVSGGEVLNSEFWYAVADHEARIRITSENRHARMLARLQLLQSRKIAHLVSIPSAQCVYTNIRGIVLDKEETSENLEESMKLTIVTIIENIPP